MIQIGRTIMAVAFETVLKLAAFANSSALQDDKINSVIVDPAF